MGGLDGARWPLYSRSRVLFIGLEGVAIDRFGNDPVPARIAEIVSWANVLRPGRIGIFSPAIRTEAEREVFMSRIRPLIEDAMARVIDPALVPTLDEIEAIEREAGPLLDRESLGQMGYAAEAFGLYVRSQAREQGFDQVWLVDSDVPSRTIEIREASVLAHLVDVAEIPKILSVGGSREQIRTQRGVAA